MVCCLFYPFSITSIYFLKEIGWREHSDKIIVVATDEQFHYAGDGRVIWHFFLRVFIYLLIFI